MSSMPSWVSAHIYTQGHRGTPTWEKRGAAAGPRLSAVLPCDSSHTSTPLSRKLKWKCGPWKTVAPIYLQTKANGLSFLSGAQAAALALTLQLLWNARWPHQPWLFCLLQSDIGAFGRTRLWDLSSSRASPVTRWSNRSMAAFPLSTRPPFMFVLTDVIILMFTWAAGSFWTVFT